MRSRQKHPPHKLIRDLALIAMSIIVAVLVVRLGVLKEILTSTQEFKFLGSFISGLFFTSLFTTPLSLVAFANISESTNIVYMAFWCAFGAVIGDLVILTLIKDTLAEDIAHVIRMPRYKRIFSIFRRRIFRWLTPLVGALIIASPLPDEMGIAMMGMSRLKTRMVIPISFLMNFIGIILIGLASNAF